MERFLGEEAASLRKMIDEKVRKEEVSEVSSQSDYMEIEQD